jgi:hypothetical protein
MELGCEALPSHVRIRHARRIVLDELPPRLDDVAPQIHEDAIDLVAIPVPDLQQRARLAVERQMRRRASQSAKTSRSIGVRCSPCLVRRMRMSSAVRAHSSATRKRASRS